MPKNPKNFNVDSVRVVKILGASIHDSTVVKGMVFGREPESIKIIINPRCHSESRKCKDSYIYVRH